MDNSILIVAIWLWKSIRIQKVKQEIYLESREKTLLLGNRKSFLPYKIPYINIGKTGHLPWWPCFSTNQNNLNTLCRGSPKDHLLEIIFKSPQQFFYKKIFDVFAFGCHGNQNSVWNGNLSAILKVEYPRIIPVRFGEILPSGLGGYAV